MARILNNITIEPINQCWLWRGSGNKHTGYGYITIRRPKERPHRFIVHRVAYMVFRRALPKGREAAHSFKCVSKRCCNPYHIRATTRSANERDKKRAKGWRLKRFELSATQIHKL